MIRLQRSSLFSDLCWVSMLNLREIGDEENLFELYFNVVSHCPRILLCEKNNPFRSHSNMSNTHAPPGMQTQPLQNHYDICASQDSAVQSQKAVSAYFSSEQIMPFFEKKYLFT